MDTLHDSSLGPVHFGTIVADVAEAGPSGDRSVPCAEAAVFVLPSPASKHASNPWIECLEASGSLRIHDHRLLGLGQEAFCRALAQSAVTLGGLRRAEFCLISATCQLEFEPGRFDRADLAQRDSSAIRAATAARNRAVAVSSPPNQSGPRFRLSRQPRAARRRYGRCGPSARAGCDCGIGRFGAATGWPHELPAS